jgi:hypothetical protein
MQGLAVARGERAREAGPPRRVQSVGGDQALDQEGIAAPIVDVRL